MTAVQLTYLTFSVLFGGGIVLAKTSNVVKSFLSSRALGVEAVTVYLTLSPSVAFSDEVTVIMSSAVSFPPRPTVVLLMLKVKGAVALSTVMLSTVTLRLNVEGSP